MDLDRRIADRLSAQHGVSSVTELLELGVSRHVVDRAVKGGLLTRLRRNVVVRPELWADAPSWDRHALRARGTARAWRGAPFALSHHSALSVLGIPVYAVDHHAHIVPRGKSSNRAGAATRIHSPVPESRLIQHEDLWLVEAAVATLQVAGTFGVEAGLVSADAVLRHTPSTDLLAALDDTPLGNGRAKAELVARLADGRMESVGESRCRWVIRESGLPTPEPQAWVRGANGFAARVDFLFRAERVIVEFDGMVKYESAQDLQHEKVREDALRRLGYEVVRITWADLKSTSRVRALIQEAMSRSRARVA